MSEKLELSYNKTLKLKNVVYRDICVTDYESQDSVFDLIVTQLENQIKAKGAEPIGPLIQYNTYFVDANGQTNLNIRLIRQANQYLEAVDEPYNSEYEVTVRNCMYVRYRGPGEQLYFATQKILLTAFEEDIELKGDSYVVYIEDDEMGRIMADVFMERVE